ncbi:DUF1634 domain-containing protein [Clostridium fermenticellae]|uniref:DUF1634 domain-containing protein n=1 Tax=Clostridium fermenticellae TaxID=2068654 RepID=A0A386H542_9CLOT|nr:DUF1634 domain-containing protein [Clostridium fermenticellae]AYD40776.1 DUF1634 domain-containing protein [Clostridium fermenticellae]
MNCKNIKKEVADENNIEKEKEEVELIIGKSLRVGVVLSAAIIIVGLFKFLVTGNSGYSGNYYPTTIPDIFKGFISFKAYGIMLTGLYILILTPVVRVAVSIFVFLKENDYLYVKITLFVLAILLFSLTMGKSL